MNYPFAALGPALHIIALVALLTFGVIALGAAIALAALPGRIATRRGHPQAEAINICGWVGLPTGFFWIAALVWAYLNPRQAGESAGTLSDQISGLEAAVTLLEQQRTGARS